MSMNFNEMKKEFVSQLYKLFSAALGLASKHNNDLEKGINQALNNAWENFKAVPALISTGFDKLNDTFTSLKTDLETTIETLKTSIIELVKSSFEKFKTNLSSKFKVETDFEKFSEVKNSSTFFAAAYSFGKKICSEGNIFEEPKKAKGTFNPSSN